jgi:heterodisulfide reductase subunit B
VALGGTPVRHRNWYLCCGKACQAEGVPLKMLHDLFTTINEEKADILCVICPTCYSQFDYGQLKVSKEFGKEFNTPPIYYFQLLAFAQGVPYDRLGFERQRFKPEILLKYEASQSPAGAEVG